MSLDLEGRLVELMRHRGDPGENQKLATAVVKLAREEGAIAELKRLLDPVSANVFADWLEEQGEGRAAALLRQQFPFAPVMQPPPPLPPPA